VCGRFDGVKINACCWLEAKHACDRLMPHPLLSVVFPSHTIGVLHD
jgi:hypothetical protein